MAQKNLTLKFKIDANTQTLKVLEKDLSEVKATAKATQQAFDKMSAEAVAGIKETAAATKKLTSALRSHGRATKENHSFQKTTINNIVRHIRQLETLVVSYYLVKKAVDSTVTAGLTLNQQYEDYRAGISAVVSSKTKLVDANGKEITGVKKLIEVHTKTKDILDQIKKASIETPATFGQMTGFYQQAIGTALASGKAMGETFKDISDNTIEFTKNMSLLGSATGMSMEKMDEEVRSLMSGNASTDSNLAKMLFGSPAKANEAVRDARTRVNGLRDLFTEAFKDVKNLPALDQFTIQLNNMKSTIENIQRDATEPLFNSLKEMLKEINPILKDNAEFIVEFAQNFGKSIPTVLKQLGEIALAWKLATAGVALYEVGINRAKMATVLLNIATRAIPFVALVGTLTFVIEKLVFTEEAFNLLTGAMKSASDKTKELIADAKMLKAEMTDAMDLPIDTNQEISYKLMRLSVDLQKEKAINTTMMWNKDKKIHREKREALELEISKLNTLQQKRREADKEWVKSLKEFNAIDLDKWADSGFNYVTKSRLELLAIEQELTAEQKKLAKEKERNALAEIKALMDSQLIAVSRNDAETSITMNMVERANVIQDAIDKTEMLDETERSIAQVKKLNLLMDKESVDYATELLDAKEKALKLEEKMKANLATYTKQLHDTQYQTEQVRQRIELKDKELSINDKIFIQQGNIVSQQKVLAMYAKGSLEYAQQEKKVADEQLSLVQLINSKKGFMDGWTDTVSKTFADGIQDALNGSFNVETLARDLAKTMASSMVQTSANNMATSMSSGQDITSGDWSSMLIGVATMAITSQLDRYDKTHQALTEAINNLSSATQRISDLTTGEGSKIATTLGSKSILDANLLSALSAEANFKPNDLQNITNMGYTMSAFENLAGTFGANDVLGLEGLGQKTSGSAEEQERLRLATVNAQIALAEWTVSMIESADKLNDYGDAFGSMYDKLTSSTYFEDAKGLSAYNRVIDKFGMSLEDLTFAMANNFNIEDVNQFKKDLASAQDSQAYIDAMEAATAMMNEFGVDALDNIDDISMAVDYLSNATSDLADTVSSISDIVATLRGTISGLDGGTLDGFYASLTALEGLSTTDSTFIDSLNNVISDASMLQDTANFTSTQQMKHAQISTANRLEAIGYEAETQFDILKAIEVNTKDAVVESAIQTEDTIEATQRAMFDIGTLFSDPMYALNVTFELLMSIIDRAVNMTEGFLGVNFESLGTNLSSSLTDFSNNIMSSTNDLNNNTMSSLSDLGTNLSSSLTDFSDNIMSSTNDLNNNTMSSLSDLGTNLSSSLTDFSDNIMSSTNDFATNTISSTNDFNSSISSTLFSVRDAIAGIPEQLSEAIIAPFRAIMDMFNNIPSVDDISNRLAIPSVQDITDGVAHQIDTLTKVIPSVYDIYTALSAPLDKIYNAITGITSGATDSISNFLPTTLEEALNPLANVASALNIPTPSQVLSLPTISFPLPTISFPSWGWETGGYTGDIATNAIAGAVHGQEYVVNAKTTRDLGLNQNNGGIFKELLAEFTANREEMAQMKKLMVKLVSDNSRQLSTQRATLGVLTPQG